MPILRLLVLEPPSFRAAAGSRAGQANRLE